MIYNDFGSTNEKVSRLGIGLAEIGFELGESGYSQVDQLLNFALDNGINFLDTAASYNESEKLVGEAVNDRRNEFFLATKAGTGSTNSSDSEWNYQKIKNSIENSLKNLKTDYVDLVQLHSCDIHILQKGDVIRALQDAQQEGKTRFIGYSGDNMAAKWAVNSNIFDTLQTSYNIADQRARTKNILKDANIKKLGIIAKRPIANGSLSGVIRKNENWSGTYNDSYGRPYFDRLKILCDSVDMNLSDIDPIELSMAFSLYRSEIDVLIIGSKNIKHVESNIKFVERNVIKHDELIRKFENSFEINDKDWLQLT